MPTIQTLEVSSELLVPGDVFKVPHNCVMPCDAILIQGQCVVNESILTGESVPVIKKCIKAESTKYDSLDFSNCKKVTLFSGTKILQTST